MRGSLVLLGLAVLVPVVMFLVGYATFDFSPAEEDALARGAPAVATTAVPLDGVAEVVRTAVVATEDASFYSNPGFDTGKIVTRSGRTITERYLVLALGRPDSSFLDAYRLRVLAVKLSTIAAKDDILQGYLNSVRFGDHAVGVADAARVYFGKDPAALDLGEAALLAAVADPVPSDGPVDAVPLRERWGSVLIAMTEEGVITARQRDEAAFPEVRLEAG